MASTSTPRRRAPAPHPEEVAPPPSRAARPRWVGWAALAVVVAGIPLVVVLLLRNDRGEADTETSDAPPSLATSNATEPVSTDPAVPPFTIGLVSSGDAANETAAATAVAALDGRAPLSSGVYLVVQPVGADPAATVTGMLGQGVVAIMTDIAGDALGTVSAAARAAGLPLCATDGIGVDEHVEGPGAAIGDATRCPPFLALAVVMARSTVPARLIAATEAIGSEDGIASASFEQCVGLVQASQPITFEPPGGPLRLATTAQDGQP